jgi:hypothetical protein
MKETDIRRYAGLMKELGLTGLEITEENSKVRLERSISAPVRETVYSVPESAVWFGVGQFTFCISTITLTCAP